VQWTPLHVAAATVLLSMT